MRPNHFAGVLILALSGLAALGQAVAPSRTGTAANPNAAKAPADTVPPCSTIARLPVTVPQAKAGHSPAEMEAVARTINLRQRGCRCSDGKTFVATGGLSVSARLREAALTQSTRMARENFFAHEDPDGITSEQRVNATGYTWQAVGENLAAGPRTAEEVVVGWAESPGHCHNLMSPLFTEIGVALVRDPQDKANVKIEGGETSGPFYTYWTQVFAAPR